MIKAGHPQCVMTVTSSIALSGPPETFEANHAVQRSAAEPAAAAAGFQRGAARSIVAVIRGFHRQLTAPRSTVW